METLIAEPEARLLVYSNDQEIARVTNEIQERARMLNAISKDGLSPEEIRNVCSSKFSIEQYIESKLLSVNKKYRELKQSGIEVTVALPHELQSLKNSLLAWESFKAGDKYSGLIPEGSTWKMDDDWLEKEFELKGIKAFVEGDKLEEYRKVEKLTDLLKFFNVPWNHIASSSVLSKIITANGSGIVPRWQYFRDND